MLASLEKGRNQIICAGGTDQWRSLRKRIVSANLCADLRMFKGVDLKLTMVCNHKLKWCAQCHRLSVINSLHVLISVSRTASREKVVRPQTKCLSACYGPVTSGADLGGGGK